MEQGREALQVCRRCVVNAERQRERAGVSQTDSRPLFVASVLVRA